jgi:rhodanese-related sulfurtransferase
MKLEQTLRVLSGADEGFDEFSMEELHRRLGDRSLTILDVLPREAYNSEHIPGAISLPLAEVNSRAGEVLARLDAEIAVYCGSAT